MVGDWFGNTVIVTAVTGNYDYILDQKKIDGVDYIYFTDKNISIPSPWVAVLLGDEHLDNRRRSKRPKLNPHSINMLTYYKYLIWIDGDMSIVNENFVSEIMSYMKNGFVISPIVTHFYKQFQIHLFTQKQLQLFSRLDAQSLYSGSVFSNNNGLLRRPFQNNLAMQSNDFFLLLKR